MHIVESFALNTGLKIDKPYIYEKYVPLPFQGDYITFQPFGKYPCRTYDYWDEVVEILSPRLKEKNIKIVQIGVSQEPLIADTVDMRSQTDFNQAAYLIKNSLLHLGIDSFAIHIGSGYNKKMVGLYAPMLPSQSGPYWSDEENFITLEPPRKKGGKPCYCINENPKTINKIYPEKIAESVLKLLGIENNYPYKTIHLGSEYFRKKIEVVPFNHVVNWTQLGVDSLIMRMDEHFNEKALQQQLNVCKCSIVTNKPINIQILQTFKERVTEFIYLVEDDSCLEYIEALKQAKVPCALVTYLEGKKLNKLKLKFIDYGQILEQKVGKKSDVEEILKDKDLSNIYYKNATLSVVKSDLFTTRVFSKTNEPVKQVKGIEPKPIIDHPDFWKELPSLILLEKTG